MNTIQQTIYDAVYKALSRSEQVSILFLTEAFARDEGDDFSPVELVLLAEHAFAHDIVHTRDQWAQQFGAVLSVCVTTHADSRQTIDIIYDDTLECTQVRIHVFESKDVAECQEYLYSRDHVVVYKKAQYIWIDSKQTKPELDILRIEAEERLRESWHRLPAVVGAWKREQMPEAYALYVRSLEDLAVLIRIKANAFPLEKELRDLSVDCDDASVRMLQSLTDDIRERFFDQVLSAYADALEDIGLNLKYSLDVTPPSKLVIRSIRTACSL